MSKNRSLLDMIKNPGQPDGGSIGYDDLDKHRHTISKNDDMKTQTEKAILEIFSTPTNLNSIEWSRLFSFIESSQLNRKLLAHELIKKFQKDPDSLGINKESKYIIFGYLANYLNKDFPIELLEEYKTSEPSKYILILLDIDLEASIVFLQEFIEKNTTQEDINFFKNFSFLNTIAIKIRSTGNPNNLIFNEIISSLSEKYPIETKELKDILATNIQK